MLSIIKDPELFYPDAEECFSPDEQFPEYPFPQLSKRANRVYRAVRNCFAQAGLDSHNLNRRLWNPLREFIRPGSKVFILCNFVFHRVPGESEEQFFAKCIHGSVLRAVTDYALLAAGRGGSVLFGNAPMQFCRWDSVLNDTGARAVHDFYASLGAPAVSQDLRLFVATKHHSGMITGIQKRDDSDGIEVDLNGSSLLNETDQRAPARYRVMNYNPERTQSFHTRGRHVYIINRRLLESDVVISLPKLKTHEKVGMSGALKGFVGTVGHKDSLPHHRFGSPDIGGDEYPSDPTHLLRLASAYHNQVQRTRPGGITGNLLRVTDRMFRVAVSPFGPVTEGAWWGNDTAWRMVLDLARIATFAAADGKMQPVPVRRHIALMDGIVAGEGQGPLNAQPVPAGVLLFGDNLVAVDYAATLLMGMDPDKLPMIHEAMRLSDLNYPLIDGSVLPCKEIFLNGSQIPLSALTPVSPDPFRPPLGWDKHPAFTNSISNMQTV